MQVYSGYLAVQMSDGHTFKGRVSGVVIAYLKKNRVPRQSEI